MDSIDEPITNSINASIFYLYKIKDNFAILDFNLIDYKKSDGVIDVLLKQSERGNYFILSSA